jgi:cellulose synthase/poly-beta-1,6-N-acetylglucosamine synthase-like glycosyltransferase
LLKRIRVYRNLDRVPDTLRRFFRQYEFTGVAEHLRLEREAPAVSRADRAPRPVRLVSSDAALAAGAAAAQVAPAGRTRVSVVVPCYNEEATLPYLANTLGSVSAALGGRYELDFVFVDDCSTDATLRTLGALFGARRDCTVLHHATNRGAAQAILTGIRAAEADVVASIDCDCTYDPHELAQMIPLLVDGVDLVTGSPYHRDGTVRNVPAWRLVLSKTASALYRVVLQQNLGTYTSFFRVYRRRAVVDVRIERGGYLGIAEMLGRLDLAGSRIVEYPTTLNVRMLGQSKMKVVRTTLGHVGLLATVLALRVRAPRPSPRRAADTREPALARLAPTEGER